MGYFLDVRFDRGVLICRGAENGTLTASWAAPEVNAESGRVRIAGAGATPLSGSGALVVVRFTVKGTGSGRASEICVYHAELNDGGIPVRTGNGLLVVSGESVAHPEPQPMGCGKSLALLKRRVDGSAMADGAVSGRDIASRRESAGTLPDDAVVTGLALSVLTLARRKRRRADPKEKTGPSR